MRAVDLGGGAAGYGGGFLELGPRKGVESFACDGRLLHEGGGG